MRVAIHQPNYLPWCGYFTKMLHADVFVILDDAAIPGGQSYVSRTTIRMQEKPHWLSVPVSKSGRPAINDVRIAGTGAIQKHWKTIMQSYSKAAHISFVENAFGSVFSNEYERLSDLNIILIQIVSHVLGSSAKIVRSSQLEIAATGDERLVQIVQALGGKEYLSGPGGMNYQRPEVFEEGGINLKVRTYKPVPYSAPRFSFIPGLSIIDALAIVGPEKTREMLIYPV